MKKSKLICSENIILAVISILFSYLITLKSPAHPLCNGGGGKDFGVFKLVSYMMGHGYIPYRDTFDHKGPLLYILNYIGDRISPYSGVWVIEFIFMAFTFVMFFKTARLVCQTWHAYLVSFMALSLLFKYYTGNSVEEFALLFVSAALYIFVEYYIKDTINRTRLVICGLSLACTLMLRPNMIAVWAVFCLAIVIKCIKENRAKELVWFIGYFLSGMMICIIPIMGWLAVNNALKDFYDIYIIFNSKYTAGISGGDLFAQQWKTAFFFGSTSVFILSFSTMVLKCIKEKRAFNIVYLLCMVVTIVFVSISGVDYSHYGVLVIPVTIYPIALIFKKIESIDDIKTRECISILVSMIVLSEIIIPDWMTLVSEVPQKVVKQDNGEFEADVNHICQLVDAKSGLDEKISVYGNWDIVYIASNREHATRYSYQFPIGEVMPEIMSEYFEELQKELPPIVVVQAYHLDDHITEFVNEYDYEMIWNECDDIRDGAVVFYHSK